MKRPFFRIPAAIVVIALLAAGCASAGGSAAPAGLEKTNLVVAAVPAADAAGWLNRGAGRGRSASDGDGTAIHVGDDPEEAASDADCVVADTWVSMGDKDGVRRHNLLMPYQVNARLMARAKPDALFMHCLPAHRGEEVTDDVMDGPQSVVFDEAENRLHVQKAILLTLLS